MILDLRKGFGDFEEYKLFKFPDNSIKFHMKQMEDEKIFVVTTLRTNDDLMTLAMVKSVIDYNYVNHECYLTINYLMYQQDDRRFADNESFGLKVVANFINSLKFNAVEIFHPHSDVTSGLIENCEVRSNMELVQWAIDDLKNQKYSLWKPFNAYWVIPDSGAFKTQFKQIEALKYPDFITCMKSRDHVSGEIKTIVNVDDLEGRDCFIVDDICLGGRTFIQIAEELKKKNCGDLYLIVSHGLFNNGIIHLISEFKTIYTTDSIITLPETDGVKIYKL